MRLSDSSSRRSPADFLSWSYACRSAPLASIFCFACTSCFGGTVIAGGGEAGSGAAGGAGCTEFAAESTGGLGLDTYEFRLQKLGCDITTIVTTPKAAASVPHLSKRKGFHPRSATTRAGWTVSAGGTISDTTSRQSPHSLRWFRISVRSRSESVLSAKAASKLASGCSTKDGLAGVPDVGGTVCFALSRASAIFGNSAIVLSMRA